MLVLADVGAYNILNKYLNNITVSGGSNFVLHLFVNDYTPTDGSSIANFTEAAGGGYAAKAITAGSFTVASNGGIMEATYPQQSFLFTGALTTNPTIYGFYMTDAANNIVCSERTTAPYTPTANGDIFALSLVLRLSSGTPA